MGKNTSQLLKHRLPEWIAILSYGLTNQTQTLKYEDVVENHRNMKKQGSGCFYQVNQLGIIPSLKEAVIE